MAISDAHLPQMRSVVVLRRVRRLFGQCAQPHFPNSALEVHDAIDRLPGWQRLEQIRRAPEALHAVCTYYNFVFLYDELHDVADLELFPWAPIILSQLRLFPRVNEFGEAEPDHCGLASECFRCLVGRLRHAARKWKLRTDAERERLRALVERFYIEPLSDFSAK